ncbi:hypothetical protein CKO28_14410 [Rhodovibrio sodomensis]|uniref:Uncharacterized protein n=1 Tax=Rhodovibrio sodomensis TaxID=1088 RepID=A0ABS1DGK4_9PROT|nr:hypothetical protein [Rhodovibrio sodomensis]MBK1669227.1 hypothetical protein [Rhodovibrio sodomensis]
MSYDLRVEQNAEDALIELARRYAKQLPYANKIVSVIRIVDTTFLDEVAEGHHGAGVPVGTGAVRVYTVPQDLLGSRRPSLDVRVAVASTAANLFHVSEADPAAGSSVGEAADLVDRQQVAEALLAEDDGS